MRAFLSRRSFSVASWLIAIAISAAWADDGPVRYRTGGIGRFEAAEMRQAQRQYPLSLTFAAQEGNAFQYLSKVAVTINRADGARMLGTTTDGPMLLAELPPGAYHIIAVDDRGRAQSRNIDLQEGAREDLRFVWPAR